MELENAIEVRNVSKCFKMYGNRTHQLKDLVLTHDKKNTDGKRQILKNISFDVKKGEAVALIGKNGCGKSTTLKLLTKILRPDDGKIEMKGRVASLIELGAGFHPDMTGRENVYINASIFGISTKEVNQRMKKIIEFSELEDFIDEPVRTYSSGMYLRLAFSVAINVEPDILLIDEILAVGDASFQQKCIDWIIGLKEKGVTIVLVSHSMSQIEKICDRAIWIEEGIIKEIGATGKICNKYMMSMDQKHISTIKKDINPLENSNESKKGSYDKERTQEYEQCNCFEGVLRVTKLLSEDVMFQYLDLKHNFISIGEKLLFSITIKANRSVNNVFFRCTVFNHERKPVWTGISEEIGEMKENEKNKIELCLDTSMMVIGEYSMNIVLFTPDDKGGNLVHDVVWNAAFFDIKNKEGIYHNLYWNIDAWGNAIYPMIQVLDKKECLDEKDI